MRRLVAATCLLLFLASAQAQGNLTDPNDQSTDDPTVSGQFNLLGVSYCVGVQLIAVPDSDLFFFMERPSTPHPDGNHYNAGLMNAATGKFVNVRTNLSMENCGHTYLENGTVAILAGHKPQSEYKEGRRGIQILDLEAKQLRSVGQLKFGHWLATATRLPNGMVTIMSDSPSPVGPTRKDAIKNPFYELWDPANPATTKLFQLDNNFVTKSKYFYYPRNFILPTGDMFVWSNVFGQIINPLTGAVVASLPSWSKIPEAKGMSTSYPFSGTAVMLPLKPADNYKVVEIMIFGGQWSWGWINTTAVGLSMRLKITCNDNGTYTIGSWQSEKMPSPRVSGSSVLLPNGQVLLINGAKRGLLGDAAAGGVAMLNEPNFWPVLYDPNAPAGRRYSTLGRSQIARLLHSTAGLTINGTVLVAGGDRSDRFWSPDTYSPSPTGFPEYRVEIFSPPFVYDTDNQPTILYAPTSIVHQDIMSIVYTAASDAAVVTSVVLVAPPSDTHTNNMHQRVVELEILGTDTDTNHAAAMDGSKTVTVRGPPNLNVAPAGPYMLFLVVGDTYGPGQWVYVTRS
ncbi:hypothetical protein Agub_g12442 [Astrephomene gubernaculifera]|uniref:Galactose oxidase n=1 Tax=Astrephomene gubernaculifera TaxID=47775 RepID=A0AAD3HRI0_9CHLO|nr:hypothetical protein Agub_g12442 [Astrephomene gubernaculifera]